ncbi:DUF2812 domain-containing protein [Enterococcus rivorum]|uniref:DUF2812 domain-containing protein n=1 Tax=Enterococcus rivorum TaxID=762845 RepID=A0A1E5KYE2_9ENTE|nr:DUF2812 domain-containing protein [Enterococcus rivorum]MBP2099573.1 hypothetical protein [Enterococcus rivorum]OEH82885.1 hypothetical protein BCR26_11140 [Enterococcus rivorum]
MKKFRVFVDMEKEENYLKEMSEKGWRLAKYNSWNIYTFEKSTPTSSNYKIDYQTFRNKTSYVDYLTLFEDSGWSHISGSQNSGFHFFLPKNNQNLNIFSDIKSSNERYKRLYQQATFYSVLFIINLFILKLNFSDIPSWYLASPAWEQSGLQIIGQVLVKTFFVVLRVAPPLFLLLCSLYYIKIGTRAKKILKNDI